jgi:hypothetical protein
MADGIPPVPPGAAPDDNRPRIGPRGEQVSEDGLHYWTGQRWIPLDRPFPPLPGALDPKPEPKYDAKLVTWVAVGSAIVLSLGVAAVVFTFPAAIIGAPLLVVAAAIFLAVARDSSKPVKSWAFGLLIGAGVAVLISPGAACFGVFFGPSVQ